MITTEIKYIALMKDIHASSWFHNFSINTFFYLMLIHPLSFPAIPLLAQLHYRITTMDRKQSSIRVPILNSDYAKIRLKSMPSQKADYFYIIVHLNCIHHRKNINYSKIITMTKHLTQICGAKKKYFNKRIPLQTMEKVSSHQRSKICL